MSEEEPQRGSDQPLFEHGGDGLRVLVEGDAQRAGARGRLRGRPGPRRAVSIQVYDIAVLERGWEPDHLERWWVESLAEQILA